MNIVGIPKFSLEGVKNPFGAVKLSMPFDTEKVSFQDTVGKMLNQVNETAAAPDALMHDAMTTGTVDVHDVMVANAKAELLLSVTTQVATKVVQAYDKILQIQI